MNEIKSEGFIFKVAADSYEERVFFQNKTEDGKTFKYRLMLSNGKQFGPEFDSEEERMNYFNNNPLPV